MNNINPLYGMIPFYDGNNSIDYYPNNMVNNQMNTSNNMINNIVSGPDLTTPQLGFIKGNMFENLYVPYKNYKPLIPEVNSERGKLLNSIRELAFALNDLDLYLDTHPDNSTIINLYGNYLKEKQRIMNEYESKYGPLNLNSKYQNISNWSWAVEPWPWESDV